MHKFNELPPWEQLFKKIVWTQLGEFKSKTILDFGSGEGVTASYYAEGNKLIAIEPDIEILKNRWKDNEYDQIIGDVSSLKNFSDGYFDVIICHNVLEYINDKEQVLKELTRVLKTGGIISIVKHNRSGRVMQMAVLLDNFKSANDLLDGKDGTTLKYGPIKYYEDNDIPNWCQELKLTKSMGIRTFFHLQQNQEKHKDEAWQKEMIELELRVSELQQFKSIAFFHHLILIKQ